ncbi:type II toxin-antitoxin system ParD family antitoxin [Neorhizobium alkalisoli]|uniref:Antitoxin ParD1/3/4 n=1 Tax=Neorhizobium alkalisoli TaxID=528178 RepID=A0A561QIQ2_9HYPH|nr:type II toxin-antitoxin system ParD family antitoxin [Neorhizobium alkalisoli]TWF50229.1 antitoxin ParD1/3/4 [Neorhizobium alkalisoli]
MGEITSISVDGELAAFVEGQVRDGYYASANEVVEAALRLLKESEESTGDWTAEALRAAIEEGEASGEPEPFDPDAFLAEMHRKHVR